MSCTTKQTAKIINLPLVVLLETQSRCEQTSFRNTEKSFLIISRKPTLDFIGACTSEIVKNTRNYPADALFARRYAGHKETKLSGIVKISTTNHL